MTNIAIIPARGGSKGVPKKNIRLLNGKPLIAYSIEQALNAQSVDKVFVTTDSDEIANIAMEYGSEVIKRPDEISGDEASSESALVHAIDYLENYQLNFNNLIFMQCTSPIRTSNQIDEAFKKFKDEKADSLLTASLSHAFLWEINELGIPVSINYDYKDRPRRQDMKTQFKENGSFYIFSKKLFKETNNRLGGKITIFVMPDQCAFEIDTYVDFDVVENLMKVYPCI